MLLRFSPEDAALVLLVTARVLEVVSDIISITEAMLVYLKIRMAIVEIKDAIDIHRPIDFQSLGLSAA